MSLAALLEFPLLPVLWIGLITVILLLAVMLFLLLRQARRDSPKNGKSAEGEKPTKTEANVPVELPMAFSGAIEAVRKRVPGRDFRYRLPWFLLLGRPSAGKTTLLSESGLASALEEQIEIQRTTGISWNFFSDGVVIDVGGWCFGSSPDAVSAWRRLLALFVNHRPEKPLDGVVVALPASDFVGSDALSPTELLHSDQVRRYRGVS
jgi:type VI secretion system protein ImpL